MDSTTKALRHSRLQNGSLYLVAHTDKESLLIDPVPVFERGGTSVTIAERLVQSIRRRRDG